MYSPEVTVLHHLERFADNRHHEQNYCSTIGLYRFIDTGINIRSITRFECGNNRIAPVVRLLNSDRLLVIIAVLLRLCFPWCTAPTVCWYRNTGTQSFFFIGRHLRFVGSGHGCYSTGFTTINGKFVELLFARMNLVLWWYRKTSCSGWVPPLCTSYFAGRKRFLWTRCNIVWIKMCIADSSKQTIACCYWSIRCWNLQIPQPASSCWRSTTVNFCVAMSSKSNPAVFVIPQREAEAQHVSHHPTKPDWKWKLAKRRLLFFTVFCNPLDNLCKRRSFCDAWNTVGFNLKDGITPDVVNKQFGWTKRGANFCSGKYLP